MKFPCPACGYMVFDEPSGSYEICDVCGWEDDHVQLKHPLMKGGANKLSLWEWQQTVLLTLSTETSVEAKFHRCSDWRPLQKKDVEPGCQNSPNGVQYLEAAALDSPRYYWEKI